MQPIHNLVACFAILLRLAALQASSESELQMINKIINFHLEIFKFTQRAVSRFNGSSWNTLSACILFIENLVVRVFTGFHWFPPSSFASSGISVRAEEHHRALTCDSHVSATDAP